VRWLRAIVWVLTVTFVVLLFLPLVRQMVLRLTASGSGLP